MNQSDQLASIFEEHYAAVVAFCARRVHPNDVDDVVSEVFSTLWRRFPDVDQPRVRAWLFGVARNHIGTQWRSDNRRREFERRYRVAHPSVTRDHADGVTGLDELRQASMMLSPADLELLELISWEDLDGSELALVLGCSVSAVHVRIHRMRERLLALLDGLRSDTTISLNQEQSA